MTRMRGDVHLVPFQFPNRGRPGQFEPRDKYIVILRNGPNDSDVPLVIASTHKVERPPRAYEVLVPPVTGQFIVETVIDCRWPYTLPKIWIPDNTYKFSLSPRIMAEVSIALVVGLQI
jgi:hypothetical protein